MNSFVVHLQSKLNHIRMWKILAQHVGDGETMRGNVRRSVIRAPSRYGIGGMIPACSGVVVSKQLGSQSVTEVGVDMERHA